MGPPRATAHPLQPLPSTPYGPWARLCPPTSATPGAPQPGAWSPQQSFQASLRGECPAPAGQRQGEASLNQEQRDNDTTPAHGHGPAPSHPNTCCAHTHFAQPHTPCTCTLPPRAHILYVCHHTHTCIHATAQTPCPCVHTHTGLSSLISSPVPSNPPYPTRQT